MRIKLQRFLATTAILAAAAAAGSGCVVNNTVHNNDGGPSGGSGGSGATGGTGATGGSGATGGTGATGGSGGSGGTGATGGSGGTAGSGGSDGGSCLGDQDSSGSSTIAANACSNLSYAGTTCGDGGSTVPLAVGFCQRMQKHMRAGVFEVFFNCLDNISGDPCNDAARQQDVQLCINTVFPQACVAPPFTFDGGSVSCSDVNNSCSSVSVADCNGTISAFDEATREDIYYCYNGQTTTSPNTGDCATDFSDCALYIDDYL